MYCNSCESHPCRCVRVPSTSPVRQTFRQTFVAKPTGITKTEFGELLYATIETLGGIFGLQQQIAGAIHREQSYLVPDLKARRDALRATLAAQLTQLTDGETRQVLDRYPMVPSL